MMIDLPGERENYPQGAQAGGLVEVSSRTIGQNIQDRIDRHKDAIKRLEAVRETLKTGTMLDVNMNDLQQALRW